MSSVRARYSLPNFSPEKFPPISNLGPALAVQFRNHQLALTPNNLIAISVRQHFKSHQRLMPLIVLKRRKASRLAPFQNYTLIIKTIRWIILLLNVGATAPTWRKIWGYWKLEIGNWINAGAGKFFSKTPTTSLTTLSLPNLYLSSVVLLMGILLLVFVFLR